MSISGLPNAAVAIMPRTIQRQPIQKIQTPIDPQQKSDEKTEEPYLIEQSPRECTFRTVV